MPVKTIGSPPASISQTITNTSTEPASSTDRPSTSGSNNYYDSDDGDGMEVVVLTEVKDSNAEVTKIIVLLLHMLLF